MLRGGLGAFLIALVVLLPLTVLRGEDPFARTPVADAARYDSWAREILDGGLAAQPVFHQAPLYPVVLSLVYAGVDASSRANAVALLQLVLLAAAIGALHPVGRHLFDDRRAGFAAAGIALLHAPFAFHAFKLLPVVVALATQTFALLALLRARRDPSAGRLAAAGIAAGVAALVRPEALLLVAAAVVVSFRKREAGRAAVLLAIAIATTLPASVHNLRQGDRVWIASSAGENLFIGNRRGGDGGHTPLDPRAGDLESQRAIARLVAEEAVGRELRPSEISRYWSGRARDEIAADVPGWLALETRKLRRLLIDDDPTDLYSLALERRRTFHGLWLLAVPPALLLAVALGGALRLVRAGRPAVGRAAPLLAFLVGHAAVLLAFFVSTRLRLPFYFLLTPLAGYGVVGALDAWRAGRRTWPAVAALVALAAVVAAPLTARVPEPERVRLAAVLSRQDRLDASLDVLRPALERGDPRPATLDQACWVEYKREDWAVAASYCERAIDAGIDGTRGCSVRTRLGRIHERLGDATAAADWHDRAVGDGCPVQARYERALFRARTGDVNGAVEDLRRVLRERPDATPARRLLERLGAAPSG